MGGADGGSPFGARHSVRVLLVTQYFWPENFPINHVVAGLVERGCAVTVLTGMPNYPSGQFTPGYGGPMPRRELVQGVPVHRVPMTPRGQSRRSLALNYLSFALSASILGPILIRERFDAVLVYQVSPVTVGIPGALMARLRGGTLCLWVQDLWPESLSAAGGTSSPMIIGAVRQIVRWIYRRCDRVLVSSRGFQASVETHGTPPDRVRYVPNTVEAMYAPLTVPADAPERSELPAAGFRLMYGGNIGAAQDFDTVLAAASATRHRPDLHWILVGDGRMRAHVEAEVARLGLAATVHLLGHKPPTAMPTWFALADALLVTLRRDPIFAVTVPSKLQAYLACGRPVLAAIDGEAAQIVTEAEAGLSVPAGDPDALAAAAIALADASSERRAAMGQAARAYFEREFARDATLDRLLACLSEELQP